MATIEKEKALDVVRQMVADGQVSQEVAERYFPELVESEDEHRIKDTVYFLETAKKHYASTEELDACIDWLKSLKDRVLPKQEWSDEDKKNYRMLQKIICDSDTSASLANKLSNWVQSLKDRVQPQTKQEWDKEDEKCIRLTTDIIDSALRAGFCVQIDRDRCIDWLKSLRPQSHWKPSEEMLEALYKVIPENVMAISEDEMLLDKLYQGLKYGRVLSKN